MLNNHDSATNMLYLCNRNCFSGQKINRRRSASFHHLNNYMRHLVLIIISCLLTICNSSEMYESDVDGKNDQVVLDGDFFKGNYYSYNNIKDLEHNQYNSSARQSFSNSSDINSDPGRPVKRIIMGRASHDSLPVNYGGRHPFELMEQNRRGLLTSDYTTTHFNSLNYEPIRIVADFKSLPRVRTLAIKKKNMYIKNIIIPKAIEFWSKTLAVFPAREFTIPSQACRLATYEDERFGVKNTDLKIYVKGKERCSGRGTLAAASSCHWDQFDRPIGGNIQFCYDAMPPNPSRQAMDRLILTAIHEFMHVFGFMSSDFAFFYDIETGLPRTPRPLRPKAFTCIGGDVQDAYVPSESTLKTIIHDGATSSRHFELVTPKVQQTVRNQFDCQDMEGASLENQPTGRSCFGDHWDERLFFNSIMSPEEVRPNYNEYLTPLSLAFLEDTGWYTVNYERSAVSPFGRGAGCDFVRKPCILNGSVPQYSKGFFCNTTEKERDYKCDTSHRVISACDLIDLSRSNKDNPPDEMQYFPNRGPTWGGRTTTTDFCPTYSEYMVSCNVNFPGSKRSYETFGKPSSRCFNTSDARPYCLNTRCNAETKKVEIISSERLFRVCDFDGQQIEIEGVLIECPKLSTLCPEMVCPFNCKGRSTCRYDKDQPECNLQLPSLKEPRHNVHRARQRKSD